MSNRVDQTIERIDKALGRLKDMAQGRVYTVGVKVLYEGKLGVVTKLNQGSEDPAGSTVNIRLADGTIVDNISVASVALELYG